MKKMMKRSLAFFLAVLIVAFSGPFAEKENDLSVTAEAVSNAAMDVVLIVDVSGSMSDTDMSNAKSAAKAICEDLFSFSANVNVAVISFASSIKSYGFSNNKDTCLSNINGLSANGGTCVVPALNQADTLLKSGRTNSVKSIVIISDGAFSESDSSVKTAAAKLTDYCNVVAMGVGASSSDATLMQSIANQGYYAYSGGSVSTDMLSALKEGYVTPAFSQEQLEVIEKLAFDIGSVLSDINLGGDTMGLPEVDIKGNGKDQSLGSIDVGINLPLNSNLTYSVDLAEKRIKILIGFKDNQSATIGPDGQTTTYWSESYQQVKAMYQNVTGKKVDTTKLWNQFSSVRGQLKKMGCSLGIGIDAQVAGYVEYDYSENKLDFVEGGVLAAADASMEFDFPVTCAPWIFVGLGITPGIGTELKIKEENSVLVFEGEISGKLGVKGELGIGEDDGAFATYVKGGISGDIIAKCAIPAESFAESFTAEITGKLYAESAVFGVEVFSDTLDFDTLQLYPELKVKEFEESTIDGITENSMELLQSTELVERSYSMNVQSQGSEFVLNDTYYDSAPQLINLGDGKLMIIWTGDDGSKPEYNRSSIFYSVYDGTAWSVTKSISNNDCYNTVPVAEVHNGKVYVVWQRTKNPIEANQQLIDVLADVDLYYSVYEDGAFTAEQPVVSNDETAELYQKIVSTSSGLQVMWIENSENDIFSSTGTNSLKSLILGDDGSISDVTVVTETEQTFGGYVGFEDDSFKIAYILSSDDKDELYIYENEATLAFESAADIININYDGKQLVYFESGKAKAYSIDDGSTSVIVEGVSYGCGFYSENGVNAILVAKRTGAQYYINAIEYDNSTNTVTKSSNVYRSDRYIMDYDAIINSTGQYVFALNTCDFDIDADDVFSNYSLSVNYGEQYNEIYVNEFAWCHNEISSLAAGEKATINFEVRNAGNTSLEKINYTITDTSTNTKVGNGTIEKTLSVGVLETCSVEYTIPENFTGTDLRIDISIDGNEENTSDNYACVSLGLGDIKVYDVSSEYKNGKVYVNCKVKNIGYRDVEDVAFTAYDSGKTGDLIFEKSLGNLSYGDEQEISFILPENYCGVLYEEDTLCSLELEAMGSSLEQDNSNNTYVYVYDNLLPFEYETNLDATAITINKYTGTESIVNIPATISDVPVTTVDSALLSGNQHATILNIPATVTSISGTNLYKSVNLTEIIVAEDNTVYKSVDGVLYTENGATLLAYPRMKPIAETYKVIDGVTTIGERAFYENEKIVNLDTEGVVEVKGYAFSDSSLKNISFADTTKKIGTASFRATQITTLDTNCVEKIGTSAFSTTQLRSCVIGESVRTLGTAAFNYCVNLNVVEYRAVSASFALLPILSITHPFEDCENLERFIIGSKVEVIPSYLLYKCNAVKSVVFEENSSLTEIKTNAFGYCSFDDIYIPKTVEYINDSAFRNCNLKDINVDDENMYYTSVDGVLFSKGMDVLKKYPEGKNASTYIVPDVVETVGTYSFYNTKALETVILGDEVELIDTYAFANCTALSTLQIPKSTTSFGSNMLQNNTTCTIRCFYKTPANEFATTNSLPVEFMDFIPSEGTQIDDNTRVIKTDKRVMSDIYTAIGISDESDLELVVLPSYVKKGNQFYGTGSKVYIYYDSTADISYDLVVQGDTNGDSACDVLDTMNVQRAVNGYGELVGVYSQAVDYDESGTIDIMDYQQIINDSVS